MTLVIITIAYYSIYILGGGVLILASIWILEKVYSKLLSHFNIYNQFVQFVWDKNKKKRIVVKPTINKGDES